MTLPYLRDGRNKTSDLLVPFQLLTANEKRNAKRAAEELLLTVLECGYTIETSGSSMSLTVSAARGGLC